MRSVQEVLERQFTTEQQSRSDWSELAESICVKSGEDDMTAVLRERMHGNVHYTELTMRAVLVQVSPSSVFFNPAFVCGGHTTGYYLNTVFIILYFHQMTTDKPTAWHVGMGFLLLII